MPLVPFVKPSEIQTLVPCDDDLAALAARVVSGGIRRSVGWDVDYRAGQTHTRLYRRRFAGPLGGLDPALSAYDERGRSRTDPCIVLPAMNLTDVASVVVDGRTLTADEWDATVSGIVYLHGLTPQRSATVTFTAGWKRQPEDEAPGTFLEVALEHGVDLASNPERLRSYNLIGAGESFSERTPLVDDSRLDPYRVNLL